MSFLEALLLGLVQGLTEFLPVSSSGHMAILENLFMKNSSTGLLFDAMLHLGTLMAVLAVFKQDIKRLLLELCKMIYDCCVNITTYFHNKNHQDARRYKRLLSNNYRKLLVLLLTATIPTAVEGLLLEHLAEQAGRNLLAPAMGFFVTGILLLIADFFSAGDKIPKNVGYGAALLIGVFQGMAIFPGISRAGVTIVGCLLCGFNRKFAVKFSFLAAVPVMLGAAVFELTGLPGSGVQIGTIATYTVAAVAAGIIGSVCIRAMLTIMRKKKFRYFSVYCIILGIAAVVCNFAL